MQRNAIESILGALVLAAAVAFFVFAYNKAGERSFAGYTLTARFSSIEGLQSGSDVRIGGVKVGQVTGIAIDPKSYLALVTMTIDPKVQLPTDSIASISTEGLLGGKYLGLLPGTSDDMLKPGSRIDRTEAAVSLESMLGQVIYGLQNSSGSGKAGSGSGQGQPAPAGGGEHP